MINQGHGSGDFIRDRIHEIRKKGLNPLKAQIIETTAQILHNHPRALHIQADLDHLLDRICSDDDIDLSRMRLTTMLRYLLENSEYKADPVQLKHLQDKKLLLPGKKLIDLGSGPGDVVRLWANGGNPALGIDASPSFVAKNDHLRLGLIDDDVEHMKRLIGEVKEGDVVATSLTLDRVAHPKNLLRTITHMAKKGRFAVASLFPIVPVDDEPGIAEDHRITYTPERHRLTNTGTFDGDLRNVQEYIEDMSHRLTDVIQIPYVVRTNSGEQRYKNYAIITSKASK